MKKCHKRSTEFKKVNEEMSQKNYRISKRLLQKCYKGNTELKKR